MAFPFFKTKTVTKETTTVQTSHDPVAPHVVELHSAVKSPGDKTGFRNKAILFGFVATLALAIGAVLLGYYYINQRTTVPPQAAPKVNPPECAPLVHIVDAQTSNSNPQVSEAFSTGRVVNDCDKAVTIYLERYFCRVSKPDHTCSENRQEEQTVVIPKNDSATFEIRQKVGGDGTCGTAQVDTVFMKDKSLGWPKNHDGLAWLADCGTNYKYQVCEANACSAPKDCPTPGVDCRPTLNKCTTNAECAGPVIYKYQVCEANACSAPKDCPTPGVDCRPTLNKCTTNAECAAPVVYQYKTCDSATQTCTPKDCPTPGVDCSATKTTCTDNTTCKVYEYKTCDTASQTCKPKNCPTVGVDCSNQSNCTSNDECKTTYNHKVCVNLSCSSVSCPNNQQCSDECSSSTECQPQTHKACVNQACQLVSGAGADTCSTNSECVPSVQTHKACLNQACQVVSGGGSDTCSMNSDCVVATHHACVNKSCQLVSGAGADTCSSDVTCRPAAVAPPIPVSGTTEMTIGAIILGFGALAIGALLAL